MRLALRSRAADERAQHYRCPACGHRRSLQWRAGHVGVALVCRRRACRHVESFTHWEDT